MDLLTIIFWLSFLYLLYRYMMEPYSYWKNCCVPSAPGYPILGSMDDILYQCAHEADLKRYRKYGRIHGFYEMRRPVLLLGDLKLIRDITIKDFNAFPGPRVFPDTDAVIRNMLFLRRGEDWKRVRMIVSPVFSSGKIKKMFSILMDSAKTLASNLSLAAKKGESIDMKKYFGAFTMDAIASSAFGTKIDSHNDPKNSFVKHAASIFGSSFKWRFLVTAMLPSVAKFFLVCFFEPSAVKFFKQATLSIIEERRKTGQKRNDFLQLLMEAEYDEKLLATNDVEDQIIDDQYEPNLMSNSSLNERKTFHNKNLSHDELVAQCVMFFAAGYETTSSVLSFVSYNLALNPEWQEKVIQEVDECLRRNPDGLTYDEMMQMKYLDMVVCETLRMYPPSIRTERLAASDYKLGDTGITVPKGMIVAIPIYAIHHDPEYYPNPEKFDPNRFSATEKAKRDQFAFLPFGAGPRNCIAMRFAFVEIKTCLVFVLSRFRFKRSPKTEVPIDFGKAQALLQAKSITLEVEERQDTVQKL